MSPSGHAGLQVACSSRWRRVHSSYLFQLSFTFASVDSHFQHCDRSPGPESRAQASLRGPRRPVVVLPSVVGPRAGVSARKPGRSTGCVKVWSPGLTLLPPLRVSKGGFVLWLNPLALRGHTLASSSSGRLPRCLHREGGLRGHSPLSPKLSSPRRGLEPTFHLPTWPLLLPNPVCPALLRPGLLPWRPHARPLRQAPL